MSTAIEELLDAVAHDDRPRVKALLKREPALASATVNKARLYDDAIFHWLYVGDTALHLAAAGYRDQIVQMLLRAGADPNSRQNHRLATPLHYAADGYVNGAAWDAKSQVRTIRLLIDVGAHVGTEDKNGATPLHRAVRTRCAAAARCLLEAGADPTHRNRSGSTPFHLAVQTTGRGGSGASIAKAAQREIICEFLRRKLDPMTLTDSKGKSVLEAARSGWVRDLLCKS